MNYCKTCKRLFADTESICPECRKKLKEITDINEPVRLAIVGGTERAMLTGLLTDAEIPFTEQPATPRGVNNDIITGYDVKLSNIYLLVPYSAIPKASELLASVETVQNENEALIPGIKSDIEKAKNGTFHADKPMSPAVKTTVRVITAILFFALVALVVFGTDKIMELIKGLFGA